MPNSAPDFQSILGVPVTVTSGYRDPRKNALVGGVKNSDHLTDSARDFVPKGMSMADAAARLKAAGGFTKVINEGDHVHASYPQGQKVAISDDDLLKALTGGKPSAAVIPHTEPTQLSDDQILKALTSGGNEAAASKPVSPAAPPAKPPVSTFADIVRSIPGGLVKGANAVAGLPGDVQELVGRGTFAALNALTGKHTPFPTEGATSLPTSGTLNDVVSKPFGGFYEPQTKPGKYADTISSFAPAALAPGSLAMRAARVAIPGGASEAAGQAAEGKPYEGLARFGGAMAGAGALGGARALLAPKEAIPTTAQIKAAATASYKQAEQAGVVIKKDAVKNLGDEINHAVSEAGIDPTLHPKATAAVSRITGSKGDLTLKKLDILRRVANGAAGSADKDERRIASIVLDHIDDFVENLSPDRVLAGDTQEASSAIKNARALWAKQAKSATIDGLIDRAKNRAETIGGSGLENALRVEFRGLSQNEKRLARFSPAEQKAIKDVARGGPISNFARTLGKLAPTNLISMLGEMGAIAHDPKALAIPVVGAAGRLAATAMTKGAASKASQIVRRGAAAPEVKPVFTPELLSSFLARQRQQNDNSNALMPAMAGAR